MAQQLEFATNNFVVYPTHGVGKITGIERQEISGVKLKLFVIYFKHEKMTLRVPIHMQFGGWSVSDLAAVIEDRKPVAALGFVHVMRWHQDGRAGIRKRKQLGPEITPAFRVDCACRFIE